MLSFIVINPYMKSKQAHCRRNSSPELRPARVVGQEADTKEQDAKMCLQEYSDMLRISQVLQPWEDWNYASVPAKTHRCGGHTTRRNQFMKPQSRCRREHRPAPTRSCNRTPLLVSTKLIQNHESVPITKPSPYKFRTEKQNHLLREIRLANKYKIKPHCKKRSASRDEVDIVADWIRRRSEGFPLQRLLNRLENSRTIREMENAVGRLPPIVIKTYDIKDV